MPADFPETPGDSVDNAETFDHGHDEQTPAEPVLQNLMIL